MKSILALALCLLLCGCPGDLKSALRMYGYMPVRPASALWQPGALVYVVSREPFTVGFVCTARQVMGPDFHPLESVTSNAELSRASKRGITMQAHVSDIVSADSELQNIKSVKMVLRNVKVFELSDYQVLEASQHFDPRCARAVRKRREQGFDVTLISHAIQADVSYVVNWSRTSKLDVDAKVAAVQNLSAKLGVDASATSDKTIAATGLVWGVRSDEYLGWLLSPNQMPKADRASSLISSDMQSQLEVMLQGSQQAAPGGAPGLVPAQPAPDVDELPDEKAQPAEGPADTAQEVIEHDAETLPAASQEDLLRMLPQPRPRPLPRNPNRHSTVF